MVSATVSGVLQEGDVCVVKPVWRAAASHCAPPDMCTLTIDIRGGSAAEIRVRIADIQAAVLAVLQATL